MSRPPFMLQQKWERILTGNGLGMDRGTKIPKRPKPHNPRRKTSDEPAIVCPPGKRVYACVSCGHQQAMAPKDFTPGQPAPTCHECFGTLRRVR